MESIPHDEIAARTDQQKFKRKLEEIQRQLERAKREHAGHFYVPLGDVEQILNEGALKSLIRYHKPQSSGETLQRAVSSILERRPNDDVSAYRFLRAFTTLIYCGNTSYIERAIRYFSEPELHEQADSNIWEPPGDDTFPTDRKSGKNAFYNKIGVQDDGFYAQFFDQKKYFCALVLKEGRRHEVREEAILPFFFKDECILGDGGAGRVYKIEVGKRHWTDKWLSNSEDMPLAIKRFKPRTTGTLTDRFDLEFGNLMKMKNARTKSQNVMLPLASLIKGSVRYLIYDLAEMTFEQYMWSTKTPYVFRADRAKAVLKNGTDLVGALSWIHQYKPYHSIAHGDIRPQNILIIRDRSGEIWKLADFDRSRAKSTLSSSGDAKKGHLGSYHAPEDGDGRRSDVWAMACMLTLILSWLSDGPHGIGNFLMKRNRNDQDNSDVFYNAKKPESPDVLSPMVKEWLGLLCARARAKEIASGKAPENGDVDDLTWYPKYVKGVTSYLSDRVFVPKGKRDYADEFYRKMEETYSQIPKVDDTEPEHSEKSGIQSPRSGSPTDTISTELSSQRSSQRSSALLTPEPVRTSRYPPRSPKKSSPSVSILSPPATVPVPVTASENTRRFNNQSPDTPTQHLPPFTAPAVFTQRECNPLCSAIGSEEPPDDMSRYLTFLNRDCTRCEEVPIQKAIKEESVEWVKKLIATPGINLEKECELYGKCTPLMRCCIEDQPFAAELLLPHCVWNIDQKILKKFSYDVRKVIEKYGRKNGKM
ncbi:hypothetical protein SLS60_006411 [Paraconiothyrium brasiliense]|uniref:Protein kinase domain-containing protein n=1 Tax=Paraconiothyrium brasiliense TaxID=300254 RepID=A0ABR3RAM4_9PLEO